MCLSILPVTFNCTGTVTVAPAFTVRISIRETICRTCGAKSVRDTDSIGDVGCPLVHHGDLLGQLGGAIHRGLNYAKRNTNLIRIGTVVGNDIGVVGISQVDATSSNSPYASASGGGRRVRLCVAVLQSNAFNSCTDHVGCSFRSNAIVPET